ncbi:mitochondrial mRNA pseudouridine synthase TRUB2 isoform X2 [Varanus komodoensis]|uniref:mitochondrial mRNA pseudouridine synthase TRUB2 isoform X2 n=1 Tax=Varanus komodoensis TaxID=61221 RepID=UPI001CF76CB9|nr:mitochondrial mRNA pseudouridine synthase TRUB2 isoform X2 [Varanus komodoensis]
MAAPLRAAASRGTTPPPSRAMRAALASLQGIFAVYKPPDVPWKLLRDTVETQLLRDLNSLKWPAPRQHVRFLPGTVEGKDGKELTITVSQVPVLADHPLVSGPIFTNLKIGAGHLLDKRSSGVFLLGAGHGNKLLTDWYNAHLTRAYTVRGLFGKATDDFSDRGKLIEKTTFEHITREQLERILSVIQGSNQKALLQPPPSPCFLPPRRHRPPKEHKEPNGSQPICFSKSPANPRQWNVKRSMGSDHQQPLWRSMLVSVLVAVFLLWCVLRPETEIDRILESTIQEGALAQETAAPPPGQEKP